MPPLSSICVYCGSSAGLDAAYPAAARALARAVAAEGIELVYGGGDVGLMGVVAGAVEAAGGRVTGVLPRGLFGRERVVRSIGELVEVGSMHERKQRMFELADGFVALPGGLGTLEELFEMATWAQLGLHTKPLGLLDVNGYWQPLLRFLDRAVAEGFVKEANRRLFLCDEDPVRLLERMRRREVPQEPRWMTSEAET